MKRTIDTPGGKMKLIILRHGEGPGILWIHGGGYVTGMSEMVYVSMGRMLAKHYGGTVVSFGSAARSLFIPSPVVAET